MLHGFDVSHWQGSGIPSGSYTFLGIKVTEGSGYTDPTAASHRAKARAKGVVPIFYHFARPEQSSAVSQAKRLIAAAGARKGELLCLDLEASKLSQSGTNKWAKAFGDALRKYAPGIKTVVYVGGYAHNGSGKGLSSHYDFWWYPRYPSSAHTTTWRSTFNPRLDKNTTGWSKPHIWQFTAWWAGKYDANISWLTRAQMTAGSAAKPPTTSDNPTSGDDDLLKNYRSAGVTKPLALPANKWSNIPWDSVYAGGIVKGKPGILHGPAKYDCKIRYRLGGLPKGAEYKVRLVEYVPDGKGWKYADNAAQQDETMSAGDDYKTIVSGPDSMSKPAHLWFQVNPGNVNGAKLEEAYVKVFYG